MTINDLKDAIGTQLIYGDIRSNPHRCATAILQAAEQYAAAKVREALKDCIRDFGRVPYGYESMLPMQNTEGVE